MIFAPIYMEGASVDATVYPEGDFEVRVPIRFWLRETGQGYVLMCSKDGDDFSVRPIAVTELENGQVEMVITADDIIAVMQERQG